MWMIRMAKSVSFRLHESRGGAIDQARTEFGKAIDAGRFSNFLSRTVPKIYFSRTRRGTKNHRLDDDFEPPGLARAFKAKQTQCFTISTCRAAQTIPSSIQL